MDALEAEKTPDAGHEGTSHRLNISEDTVKQKRIMSFIPGPPLIPTGEGRQSGEGRHSGEARKSDGGRQSIPTNNDSPKIVKAISTPIMQNQKPGEKKAAVEADLLEQKQANQLSKPRDASTRMEQVKNVEISPPPQISRSIQSSLKQKEISKLKESTISIKGNYIENTKPTITAAQLPQKYVEISKPTPAPAQPPPKPVEISKPTPAPAQPPPKPVEISKPTPAPAQPPPKAVEISKPTPAPAQPPPKPVEISKPTTAPAQPPPKPVEISKPTTAPAQPPPKPVEISKPTTAPAQPPPKPVEISKPTTAPAQPPPKPVEISKPTTAPAQPPPKPVEIAKPSTEPAQPPPKPVEISKPTTAPAQPPPKPVEISKPTTAPAQPPPKPVEIAKPTTEPAQPPPKPVEISKPTTEPAQPPPKPVEISKPTTAPAQPPPKPVEISKPAVSATQAAPQPAEISKPTTAPAQPPPKPVEISKPTAAPAQPPPKLVEMSKPAVSAAQQPISKAAMTASQAPQKPAITATQKLQRFDGIEKNSASVSSLAAKLGGPEPIIDDSQKEQLRSTMSKIFNVNISAPRQGSGDELSQLKQFGIPSQTRLVDALLDADAVQYDFGGLMREYYSYVLRSYCLINMQDRYRGASSHSKCFTTIDVSKIGSKEEEQDKGAAKKTRKMEAQLQLLKKVAYDADHFNYIKSMANTQPVTLPITLLHGVTEEMVPVLEDVFRFYGKNLGHDHICTHKAGSHYIKMRRRVAMYNKISGGSSFSKLDEGEAEGE
ncbi:hypothetical protein Fcan01_05948 [Folsomia candida]|uniref:Uncharacterized protein n=2 Tax=Folsomia candida TaxID=158441 RepID=A0A226ENR4_FOLCA|nr:hypothetical protein Fcan01_05948 [Folsomia candida]